MKPFTILGDKKNKIHFQDKIYNFNEVSKIILKNGYELTTQKDLEMFVYLGMFHQLETRYEVKEIITKKKKGKK